MHTNTRKIVAVAITSLSPMIAMAATDFGGTPFGGTINIVKGALNLFLGSAIAIATAFFFWNVIKFIRGADNPEVQKKAKSALIYSGGALFAMVGIWTLISYVVQSLGITGGDIPTTGAPTGFSVPQVN